MFSPLHKASPAGTVDGRFGSLVRGGNVITAIDTGFRRDPDSLARAPAAKWVSSAHKLSLACEIRQCQGARVQIRSSPMQYRIVGLSRLL